MRIWECDMCHKQYKEDGPVIRLTTGDVGWDLCAICFESVKKYINIQGNPQLKRILEYDEKKQMEYADRKELTCDSCEYYNHVSSVCGKIKTPHFMMGTATACDKFERRVVNCEPSKVNEPRKTCNTCVHFMVAKSRCMKKRLPIHENDRDACLGWSDKKCCRNCAFYPTCDIPDAINQEVGCVKWES